MNPRLTDLGTDRYRLRRPIAYTLVRDSDGSYLARWPTTGEYGCGETEAEAIAMLQECIVMVYEFVHEHPDDQLGAWPQRVKRTLARLIEPAPRCFTVEYQDGECTQIVAVFTTEALARAFWAALPDGRWGDYTVCKEHCEVREYPVLDALPEMRLYAGRRPEEAGKP